MKRRGAVQLSPAQAEAATQRYYYWLLLAIFIEYARPASYAAFLRIPFLYSVIPLLLLLMQSFAPGLRPLKEIFSDRMGKWMLAYLGMITFSMSYAIVTEFAFNTVKLVLGYGALFIMIARICTTPRRVMGVVGSLLLAHVFLLAMNPKVITEPEVRNYIIGATFLGDGNDFSLSLCVLFPCAIELGLMAKSFWVRILVWIGILIVLFAIVASQSRGATIGLVCVLGFLWLRSPRKMLSLFGILVAGMIMLLYAPPEYFQRMQTISHYQEEGSAIGRILAWKAGTNMALDNPLLGIGAGNFPVAYGTRYKPAEASNEWKTAHSSYFLVLGEMGFTGLILLLGLVIGNIRLNQRVRGIVLTRAGPEADPVAVKAAGRQLYMLTAAMLGFATAGAFLSAAYYPHVFILTGLLLAARANALQTAGLTMQRIYSGEFDKPVGRVRKQRGAPAATPQPSATLASSKDSPRP